MDEPPGSWLLSAGLAACLVSRAREAPGEESVKRAIVSLAWTAAVLEASTWCGWRMLGDVLLGAGCDSQHVW